VREVELKWRSDVDEYKALLHQWKEKYAGESDLRKMLDENLRVLSRRMQELELELQDKVERLAQQEGQRRELEGRLGNAGEREGQLRREVEEEMRAEVDRREREMRKLREQMQALEHKHRSEVEAMKLAKQQELDVIEDKIKLALAKKHEIIAQLGEEGRLKDLTIDKLKAMLDRQRKELLMAGLQDASQIVNKGGTK
jgi:chromosome segregation ATPase